METKKQWVTPELKNLDVDMTLGGANSSIASEDTNYHT
jgi:hypothetical protein